MYIFGKLLNSSQLHIFTYASANECRDYESRTKAMHTLYCTRDPVMRQISVLEDLESRKRRRPELTVSGLWTGLVVHRCTIYKPVQYASPHITKPIVSP